MCEALRHSFTLMLGHVRQFLIRHLAFVPRRGDPNDVRQFWMAVGVEADMIELFTEVDPWMQGESLLVSDALEREGDGFETVGAMLLYAFKWRRF